MMKSKKIKSDGTISHAIINKIGERLKEGKRVRRTLPLDGRLHIDRSLPFLVVYRRPCNRMDNGTDYLVKGEASYLIASDSKKLKNGLTELIRTIAETLADKCKAFLIIEIWSGTEHKVNSTPLPARAKPAFRIITSESRPPTSSIEALKEALRRIKINRQSAYVEVVCDKKRYPKGLGPLIPEREARKLNCFIMGLEISPLYRQSTGGEIFPFMLRKFHMGLSRALKKTFYKFSHDETDIRPSHYHAMGRRAMVKAVWEVDRRLADVSSAFDFLLLLTPLNIDSAWAEFKKQHYERLPTFYYRPRSVDPELLKRKLYEIHIDNVEDPTLSVLFREKRTELDRKLTMLEDRNTGQFVYGSLQLFGDISSELTKLSEKLLQNLAPRSRDDTRGGFLGAEEFAGMARREIEYYCESFPSMSANVQVRNDVVGMMVSGGNLLINKNIKVPVFRVEALLQHEVGTHVVTYWNGQAQPFRQLYCGLTGYDELQEGLAVLVEYLVGGMNRPRLRMLAGRVIASQCLIDGASFIDTFRTLNHNYEFEQRAAFTMTARTYRAGGITKDVVYLRGLVSLLEYLKNGGDLEILLLGKFALKHIPIIKELQLRGVLHPVPLRPRYFDSHLTTERLNLLRKGLAVTDLI
jgi:uncharacterized protein (TIGR02421 family)